MRVTTESVAEKGFHVIINTDKINACQLPLNFILKTLFIASKHARVQSHLINDKSPYEILYGVKPHISSFKTFGCISYLQIAENKRHKLDPRSPKCVFLTYKNHHQIYKVFSEKKMLFSKDYFMKVIKKTHKLT